MTVTDEELRQNIKDALTYHIQRDVPGRMGKMQKSIETIRNYSTLLNNIIAIPRGRKELIPEGYEIVDRTITVPTYIPDALIPLRPEQSEVYDNVESDCFINALPGWGKTFTALHIAKKLRQKTLVVTHTSILKDQWCKEIEELFGFIPATISKGVADLNSPIVVGNVQTVTKFSKELAKEFGTLIIDEAHHSPATTFTTIVDSSYAKYRIALSGTMNRKDGRHILFPDYFSSNILTPPQSHTLNPTVKLVRTGISLTPGAVWAKKINDLLYDPEYQEFIATVAAMQVSRGHSVLIIADRVDFLKNVQRHLGETCLLVTGETSFEERESVKEKINSGEASSIAGSRQIFSEGVSVNRLSCVILASPISHEGLLEQIIGRIMRMFPGKPTPEVLDMQFSGPSERKQNNARLAFYMEKGWQVESY